MIGGMGHAMTALGVALYDKKDVICLDGDVHFLCTWEELLQL